MGTKNLGNVAGVVKGITPPLEADGSEKRYVLWAKEMPTNPVSYQLMYYDITKNGWYPIIGASEADINLIKHYIFGTLNLSEIPNILDDRSVSNLIELFDNKSDITHNHPDLEDYINDLQSGLDGKFNIPTMTDNYYGLWDNINKKFIDGKINEIYTSYGNAVTIGGNNQGHDKFQVGRIYNDEQTLAFPDGAYFGVGYDDTFNGDHNILMGTSGDTPDFNSMAYSYLVNGYGYPIWRASIYSYDKTGELSDANGDIMLQLKYGNPQPIIEFGVTASEMVFKESPNNASKLLEYKYLNNYWQFYKPIKGGNIKDGLRFTLPTSITPTPNTLVPKTDGSRPIWYNNSSVANDLAFKSEIFSLNLYKEYSTPPSTPPKALGLNSVAIGDGTEANSTSMFVFGYEAGKSTINANNTFIFGTYSGRNAHYSSSSIFIGNYVGQNSMSANNSIFLGDNAGSNASNSSNSIFIGTGAGASLDNSPYSVLLGYSAGKASTNKIGSNNIIIGTNISLPSATTNALNIGGIIYGINTYSTKTGEPSTTPSSNGMIGIGVVTPTEKLDVNGNVKAIDYKGQSIKFNLQTSITPTPNTLVPKTDGSGLIWYNNSSVPKELNFGSSASSWSAPYAFYNGDYYQVNGQDAGRLTVSYSKKGDFVLIFIQFNNWLATSIPASDFPVINLPAEIQRFTPSNSCLVKTIYYTIGTTSHPMLLNVYRDRIEVASDLPSGGTTNGQFQYIL